MFVPSSLLRFSEDRLQVFALCFMTAVYVAKISWILMFPAGKERQASTANGAADALRGARHSLLSVALPWEMPSTRKHPFLYAQFALFHAGVALSILMSFLIPYAPGSISGRTAVRILQAVFAAAFVAALLRMIRRIVNPYVRSISTPDDYFSLAILTIWLLLSVLAAPNRPERGEFWLVAYFILTAFLLVYVPFSKISHYLYYPFSRWYLGKTLGHRGVYPIRRRFSAHA